MNRISKNFELPKVAARSNSLKDLKRLSPDKKNKCGYNKWFIDPTERFSKSKEKASYKWDKDGFMFNIIREKGKVLDHQYLPKFINNSR